MPKINQKEYEVLKGLGNTWKWIARNKDGDLGVYDEKVIKVKFYNFWIMAIKKKINSTLFSFIQWKDEEPHNISELIEEYEFENVLSDEERFYELYNVNESEETEVKKDKEWAKKEVYKYFSYKGVIEARNALVFVKGVIDQLDETEITNEQISDWFYERNVIAVDRMDYEALTQDEPAKLVIPKFVADYLDFAKSDTTLMRVLELANTRNEWEKWEKEYDWIEENHELFAKAWLDGYEVEEEQKYIVLSKDKRTILLTRWADEATPCAEPITEKEERDQLTEQEIKDYDPRYWAFAVKVEELEE